MMPDPTIVKVVESADSNDYRAEARRIYQNIIEQLMLVGGEAALSVSKLSEQLYEIVVKQTIEVCELKAVSKATSKASYAEVTASQKEKARSRSRSKTKR